MPRIPVIIPCFNNPTYVSRMLSQLDNRKIDNVILIDSASTYPPMLELLQRAEKDVRVIRLRSNRGPRYFCTSRLFFLRLPSVFCVTDPDLRFNDAMPSDFLNILLEATETFSVGKAGLALDISDQSDIRSDRVVHLGKTYTICEWEAQFWEQRISETAAGDPIYKADIDTTFALYNKRLFSRRTFSEAVRFGGRFAAKHLPWCLDNGLPKEEEVFYRMTGSSHSWYFGEKCHISNAARGI